MIAKKKQLNINTLVRFSLQSSLQGWQLSPSTCLQVQAVLFKACKEKNALNQPNNKTFFAALFANNLN